MRVWFVFQMSSAGKAWISIQWNESKEKYAQNLLYFNNDETFKYFLQNAIFQLKLSISIGNEN